MKKPTPVRQNQRHEERTNSIQLPDSVSNETALTHVKQIPSARVRNMNGFLPVPPLTCPRATNELPKAANAAYRSACMFPSIYPEQSPGPDPDACLLMSSSRRNPR